MQDLSDSVFLSFFTPTKPVFVSVCVVCGVHLCVFFFSETCICVCVCVCLCACLCVCLCVVRRLSSVFAAVFGMQSSAEESIT